jgi:hypothetical protein
MRRDSRRYLLHFRTTLGYPGGGHIKEHQPGDFLAPREQLRGSFESDYAAIAVAAQQVGPARRHVLYRSHQEPGKLFHFQQPIVTHRLGRADNIKRLIVAEAFSQVAQVVGIEVIRRETEERKARTSSSKREDVRDG